MITTIQYDANAHVTGDLERGPLGWTGPNGIFSGVPEAVYHRIRRMSNSILNKFDRTAAHARYLMKQPDKETEPMVYSSACHTLLLEPERFEADVHAVALELTAGGRITAQSARDLEAARLEHGFRNVLRDSEAAEIRAIIKGMDADPYRAEYAAIRDETSHHELTCFFDYPVVVGKETIQVPAKCRLDLVSAVAGVAGVTDFKFVVDASPGWGPREFGRVLHERGYHRQQVFYRSALTLLTGDAFPGRIWAVEKDPPHVQVIYEVDEDTLEDAAADLQRRISAYALGIYRDYWPGYVNPKQPAGSARKISQPVWAFASRDEG